MTLGKHGTLALTVQEAATEGVNDMQTAPDSQLRCAKGTHSRIAQYIVCRLLQTVLHLFVKQ